VTATVHLPPDLLCAAGPPDDPLGSISHNFD
jgi:hypothetical protein